jgi:hypothetical protein
VLLEWADSKLATQLQTSVKMKLSALILKEIHITKYQFIKFKTKRKPRSDKNCSQGIMSNILEETSYFKGRGNVISLLGLEFNSQQSTSRSKQHLHPQNGVMKIT